MENKLKNITNLFEGMEISSIWDSEREDYYFSVVDVITVLTESKIPRNYWSDLKRRLIEEGSELHEKIVQLKMEAKDGKMRNTDTLDTEGIFRLIESVPSPKAEPFKMWLATLEQERIDEEEVALTDLGEIATRELAKEHKPFGLKENKNIAKRGGNIAKITRDNLEKELGRAVISNKNNLNYKYNKQIENKK